MRTHLSRACLLALVTTLTASASDDPPPETKKNNPFPEPRPGYTAFPDLKPSPRDPDPKVDAIFPVLPELPANAPALRKVRREQARAGLAYLARISKIIQVGSWDSRFLFDTTLLASEVYVVAAETEEKLTDQVPWYEERVRKLKELEQFHTLRVTSGRSPPQHVHFLRFHRLGAEADLLRIKDEVARTGGGMPRALAMKKAVIVPLPLDPKNVPEPYTAFPDLKPPSERKVVTNPDGTERLIEEKGVVPLPRLPVLPTGAPVLRKVRHEQVLEGLLCAHNSSVLIPVALTYRPLSPIYLNTADAYHTAAELEERFADRVPWYQARVRALKETERFITIRVVNGTDPPHDLDAVRFHRLRTEADLIRLKSEVEKTRSVPGPEPIREEIVFKNRENSSFKEMRPHFTTFPDLKPRTTETVEVKDDAGMTRLVTRDKDVVPLPPLPAITDAQLLRKVRLEQLHEGLSYLDQLRQVVLCGAWSSAFFIEHGHMTTEVYRVAAELEDAPAKRVPWYEARVRDLKDIERFTEIRLKNGSDPPQRLNSARVWRLQAEAELLMHKTAAEATAPIVVCVPCPPTCCPPACARPRGGLLPRLFHRR